MEFIGEGDDATGRGVAGGGEERISSKTGTMRWAAASPGRRGMELVGDEDDVVGRNVESGGEEWTSPETGMARRAAASPAEARNDLARDGADAAGRGVVGGGCYFWFWLQRVAGGRHLAEDVDSMAGHDVSIGSKECNFAFGWSGSSAR